MLKEAQFFDNHFWSVKCHNTSKNPCVCWNSGKSRKGELLLIWLLQQNRHKNMVFSVKSCGARDTSLFLKKLKLFLMENGVTL